jgi:hypothetical protein
MQGLPFAAPALPLDEAGKYVAAAYVVFLLLLVVYVGIMAAKLARIERELRDLAAFAEERKSNSDVGGTPGGSGREAEQPPVGSAQPPTGSDRNLTLSESVGGQAERAQGASDV